MVGGRSYSCLSKHNRSRSPTDYLAAVAAFFFVATFFVDFLALVAFFAFLAFLTVFLIAAGLESVGVAAAAAGVTAGAAATAFAAGVAADAAAAPKPLRLAATARLATSLRLVIMVDSFNEFTPGGGFGSL